MIVETVFNQAFTRPIKMMGNLRNVLFEKIKELENGKGTAYNERFGTMAAVSPQTILCEIARYYPAGSSVEAATAPSRWDVVSNGGALHNGREK